MARNAGPASEYAGTDDGDIGTGGDAFDPTAVAAGNGAAGSGDGTDDFDPAIHIGRDKRNADGSYRRKRGRAARAGGTAKAATPVSVAGIEAVLVSIHAILATATKAPELALEPAEAETLAKAFAEVGRHYPMTIDPKMMAWANLTGTAAMIYGPRIFLIRKRVEDAKRNPEPPTPTFGLPMSFVNPVQ